MARVAIPGSSGRVAPSRSRRAFSLTELLVVIGVIGVLLALLLPALARVRSSGRMSESMSNMRQIASAMASYAADNSEVILASQFNHQGDAFSGFARRGAPFVGEWHSRGTWADTLWTRNEMGVFPEAEPVIGDDYHNNSPDKRLYELLGDSFSNPLRSGSANSRNAPRPPGGYSAGENAATPFGAGAQEVGWPGYFAANNFFNADKQSASFNGHWSTGQIRVPAASLYLVDSFAGETIEDEDADEGDPDIDPFNNEEARDVGQVDFRYNDLCLALFLDGHVDTQSEWLDLDELEQERNVRVRGLGQRRAGG